MSFGFFQSFAPKKSLKMVENRCCLKREGVYRWFSGLSSAQRTEFLCGLLDLCVPVELRFLGSCLEDLARKDYHSLRDAEIKANNPADLALLANVTDEVVRSKLLVSLALLGSDNRPAAGALFRTLTHIDAIIHDYGLRLNDGRTGEQFLLLFTMAANHPAFSFHQKQVLRQQLAQIQELLQSNGTDATHGGNPGSPAGSTSLPAYIGTPAHLTCCAKVAELPSTPPYALFRSPNCTGFQHCRTVGLFFFFLPNNLGSSTVWRFSCSSTAPTNSTLRT